ncbi:MAG: FAD-binding oxidoreductase, partial [Ktedonobacteraceae bacterium]|nr:FAD-binding oxidoreductase [Ktedonobacteraceae bacterium]
IALQGEGISIEMLNREQVQGLIKTPLSAEIIGGRLLAEDGIIHPARFIQGLAHASQRYGAQIYQASVTHVHSHSKGVQVHTVQGSLDARAVIVATNAWISELLPEVSDLITPVRGQILSYAPTASVFPVGLSASVTETGEYWQQRLDGTIIVGGCRAAALGQDRGVYLETPTPEVQHALEQVLPRFFPMLSDLHIDHRWAGLMAFTPDYLPIADQMPAYPHVWVVGGFCGHGMPFGMRLSQLLAEEIARDTPLEELKSFRFDRATLTPSTSRLRLQQLP